MSLLNAIKSRKNSLKETETVITQPDGKIYKESKNKIEAIGVNYGFVIDTKPDQIPARIIDNLYLGSQDCCDIEVLKSYNIKNVLSIGIEAPNKYPDINYNYIECLDLPETNIKCVIKDSSKIIEKCLNLNENILVHCNAGVSRSVSVVIGFLMLKKGLTYNESFELCKKARSCIKPNVGFERQLRKL